MYFYLRTVGICRPDNLVELGLVFVDDRVGRFDYIFRRTVILLQTVGLYAFIILLEVQDVIDVCSAESINTLRIVTNDADILKFVR
ncbi:hypothetical protein D3C86_1916730 [compost metagenome]